MAYRPRWLAAGAIVIGIGAAMAIGCGVAAADTGSTAGGASSTQSAVPKSSYSATAPAAKAAGTAKASVASSGQAAEPASVKYSTGKSARAGVSGAGAADVQRVPSVRRQVAADGIEVTAAISAPSVDTVVTQVVSPLVSHAKATAIRTSAASVKSPDTSGPAAGVVLNALSAFGAPAPAERVATATATVPTPALSNGVTGVVVGHSNLNIPCATCGANGYTAPADWYFPTQADGTVSAAGIIWLQHGFLADKSFYSVLATTLAQQTNSIVVAPTISSFPLLCADCSLNSVAMQQGIAQMFVGDRAALNISANAAGYQGALPEQFILAGHSAGGGLAAAVAGYTVDNGAALGTNGNRLLLGVVMFDGVSNGTLPAALTSLDTLDIPVYQIAAPPQLWNAFGKTTDQLLALRPGQFDGVVLVGGSHVDSALGSTPIIDFILQLVTQFSPAGNTAAVYTLSTGWINDMYVGAGPTDPQFGLYGQPGQLIVLGPATAIVLPAQPPTTLAPWSTAASARTAVAA